MQWVFFMVRMTGL